MKLKNGKKVQSENEMYVVNQSEITIEKKVKEVYRWVVFEPLERQLPGTKKIPGVISTETINNVEIGRAGHLRLVRLKDGNSATEEHTFIDQNWEENSNKYFSYKVFNYTLSIAKNIEYAKGEWWFTPNEDKTDIVWRYSFKLDNKKMLGKIGWLGRFLFHCFFIRISYNEFMIETLKKLKLDLEKAKSSY